MVAFYNDHITHPKTIGFHISFSISVSLYCSLGFGVMFPNARVFSYGYDQVWQAVFMVRPNRIEAGGTPVVQYGIVR